MYMKNYKHYCIALMAAATLAGCNPDGVDDVSFGVSTAGDTQTVRVGEEVKFLFDGNADYITFFSGEEGSNYAHKDRTTVSLKSLALDAAFKQQYTDKEYYDKEIISVYVSEDFNADYTVEGIKKSRWTKISGQAAGQLPVPAPPTSAAVSTSGCIDLAAYADKNFFVALEYNAPKRNEVPTANGGGKYVQAPRIDVQSLVLNKETADGQQVAMSNTATEWGFQIVYENSEKLGNYLVNDQSLLFQPQTGKEHNDDDVIVWMVSQRLQPNAVSPDRGTAIKGTDAALAQYTHIYTRPGTYTATFVATNANLWNSDRVVKELIITVTE